MSSVDLSAAQLKIMRILWEKGKATAREITDILSEDVATALSTVQTLLRRMETKGAVYHSAVGRTFYFVPTVEIDTVRKSVFDGVISNLFFDSPENMIVYLLESGYISPKKMKKIRKKYQSN